MMKKVAVVLLLLVCSIQVQAEDNSEAEPAWFGRGWGWGWHYPHPPLPAPKWPYPYWKFPHPPISAPKPPHPYWSAPHHPPMPAPKWKPTPKLKSCLSDLSAVHACMPKLYASFNNHDFSKLGDCCSTFKRVDEDCAKTIFYRFAPVFELMVKDHCSSKA